MSKQSLTLFLASQTNERFSNAMASVAGLEDTSAQMEDSPNIASLLSKLAGDAGRVCCDAERALTNADYHAALFQLNFRRGAVALCSIPLIAVSAVIGNQNGKGMAIDACFAAGVVLLMAPVIRMIASISLVERDLIDAAAKREFSANQKAKQVRPKISVLKKIFRFNI